MLTFLRKYQKIFFVIVIFFIVVTFSFFGTQSAIQGVKKPKDKVIAEAIDGSKIKLSDIERLSYFLATDAHDIYHSNNLIPNFFNDGVIRNDLIKTGLAKVIFEKYFDQIKPSIDQRFNKIVNYRPFVHMSDSNISAENIWKRVNPDMISKLVSIKEKKEVSLDFINNYLDLYLEEMRFSSSVMQRMMIYQEKQTSNIEPDMRLYQDQISLFNHKNAMDWFGKDFIDITSQLIINVAKIASEKGYSVTYDEALASLSKNLKKAIDQNKLQGSFSEYFNKQLQILGLDEKNAVNIWQKVMLFRKYFTDVSNNAILDNLAQKEFASFAATKADVTVYELPDHLKLKNFDDLMKFDVYLDIVARKSIDLPNELKKVEHVEKLYPELVEKQYEIKIKDINLDSAAVKIKIKDMYSWQLEDQNFEKIRNKFPEVQNEVDRSKRYDILEKLNYETRARIDNFSRLEMIKESPDIISNALNAKDFNTLTVNVRDNNFNIPVNLKNKKEFLDLLEKKDKILKYTQDDDTFLSFEVVQRPKEKYIISFKQACEDKTIDKVVDKYLNEKYLEIRANHAEFKNEDDSYKAFSKVKIQVFQIVFADILKEIKSLTKDNTLNSYAKYRLYPFVNSVYNLAQNESEKLNKLNEQWKLNINNIELSRSKDPKWMESLAFNMKTNEYSKIQMQEGSILFFKLNEFKNGELSQDNFEKQKEALSFEIQNILLNKVLKQIMQKNSIVVPVRVENKDV